MNIDNNNKIPKINSVEITETKEKAEQLKRKIENLVKDQKERLAGRIDRLSALDEERKEYERMYSLLEQTEEVVESRNKINQMINNSIEDTAKDIEYYLKDIQKLCEMAHVVDTDVLVELDILQNRFKETLTKIGKESLN